MSGQKSVETTDISEEGGKEQVGLIDELSLKEEAEKSTDVENTKKLSTDREMFLKEEIKESTEASATNSKEKTQMPTDPTFCSITEEPLNEETDDDIKMKNEIEQISKEIESFMLEKEKKNSQNFAENETKQEVKESEEESENPDTNIKSYHPPPTHAGRLSEILELQLLSPSKTSNATKNLNDDNDMITPTSQDAASPVETSPQGSENISQKEKKASDLEIKEEKQRSDAASLTETSKHGSENISQKEEKAPDLEMKEEKQRSDAASLIETSPQGSEKFSQKEEKASDLEMKEEKQRSETELQKTEECEIKNDAEDEPKLPLQKLLAKVAEEFPTVIEPKNETSLQKYSRTLTDTGVETRKRSITYENTPLQEKKLSNEFLKKSALRKESSQVLSRTQIDKKNKKYSFSDDDSAGKKLRFGDEQGEVRDKPRHLSSKGMRFEFGRSPKTCERFLKVEEYAKLFIDEITEEALCYIESNILDILHWYLFLQQKEEILDNDQQLKSLKESHLQTTRKTHSPLQALARMFAYSTGPQSNNSTLNLELSKLWNIYLFGNWKKIGNTASNFYMETVTRHVISIAMKQSLVCHANSIQYHRLQPVCILRSNSPELDLVIALWMCIIASKVDV